MICRSLQNPVQKSNDGTAVSAAKKFKLNQIMIVKTGVKSSHGYREFCHLRNLSTFNLYTQMKRSFTVS